MRVRVRVSGAAHFLYASIMMALRTCVGAEMASVKYVIAAAYLGEGEGEGEGEGAGAGEGAGEG